jgi:hypothetical protein
VAGDLLADTQALRRPVDLDVKHEAEVADDLDRRIGFGQLAHDAHFGQLAERHEVGRELGQSRGVTG